MNATTRRLFLLRHAKTEPGGGGLSDHERRLVPRGIRDAGKISRHLVERDLLPELVICSTAARALETLEVMRQTLDGVRDVRSEPRLYEAATSELLKVVQGIDDSACSAMLVGHNPSMQALASYLAADDRDQLTILSKYPTGCLTVIEFHDANWSEIQRASGKVIAFITPSSLT